MNVGWGSTIQPMRAEESPLALPDSELRIVRHLCPRNREAGERLGRALSRCLERNSARHPASGSQAEAHTYSPPATEPNRDSQGLP